MQPTPDESNGIATHDAHVLAKWARVYGQNRGSLAVGIFLAVITCLTAAIGGLSYLAGEAYRSENLLLFVAAVCLLIPVIAGIVYLAVPGWGGRLAERIVARYYAEEGGVSIVVPVTGRRPWAVVLVVYFTIGVVAMVWLGQSTPAGKQQPVSALFVVPFLVVLALMMRPGVGFVPLLWPALYALHAVLIVAGAPIVFTGMWTSLNLLIPIAGYGLLTAAAGYAYSRFAWHRLTALSRVGERPIDETEEANGP